MLGELSTARRTSADICVGVTVLGVEGCSAGLWVSHSVSHASW